MEQIKSIDGGWEDQVGGSVNGIKYIIIMLGLNQKIKIDVLEISEEVIGQLKERYVFGYTG